MRQPLAHDSCLEFAETMDDTPQNVILLHLLRRGLCRAFVLGSLPDDHAVVIQDRHFPEEPVAFGNDPEKIWDLLKTISGWTNINVADDMAKSLGALIQADINADVRYLQDIYLTLERPVECRESDAVRLMTESDLAFLKSVPNDMQPSGFGGIESLLTKGFVAGAIVDGKLISVAQTYARTAKYADIGVKTHPEYRTQWNSLCRNGRRCNSECRPDTGL